VWTRKEREMNWVLPEIVPRSCKMQQSTLLIDLSYLIVCIIVPLYHCPIYLFFHTFKICVRGGTYIKKREAMCPNDYVLIQVQ
jgi:hypothetical protein